MTILRYSLILLALTGSASAVAFDDQPAQPERILAGMARQRPLPEQFSAVSKAAWEEEAPTYLDSTDSLIEAITKNDVQAVKAVLADGVPVNAAAESGQRPLLLAVAAGNAEIARLLIQAGANPDAKDTQGRTPLGLAVAQGQLPMVRMLLKAGAKVDLPGDNKATPVHEAVRFDQPDILRLLLAEGPNLGRLDRDGFHPLAQAAALGRLQCLHMLLQAESEADLADKHGLTALFWSRRNNHELAEALLLEHGAVREAWPIAGLD
jgi:ankyrin repeat protein